MIALASFGKLRELTGIRREKFQTLSEDAGAQYKSFDTQVDGKWRHIDNPRRDLKSVQSILLRKVLQRVDLPAHMYGARRGSSFLDHARHHLSQSCIMTLDLRHCYPSTTHEQVHQAFKMRVGCSPKIAHVLTKLCTLEYHLPQGAPTSGYLAHLVLWDLFDDLSKIARRHHLKLSFYVDDIALSGAPPAIKAAKGEAIDSILRHDHSLRNRKKKVMEGDARVITSLRVRDTTEVLTDYIEDLTTALVKAGRAGTVSLTAHQSLTGRVDFVRSISASQAAPLKEMLSYVQAGTIVVKKVHNNISCDRGPRCFWKRDVREEYAVKDRMRPRALGSSG
jgi:hypothetical protein